MIWINAANASAAKHDAMATFRDQRERELERKIALDPEMAFNVASRRNALLGHWATARMGLSGSRADAYVKDLVEGQAANSDPEAVATRVMDDLAAHGKPISRDELDAAIARFTARARAEIVRSALR